MNMSGPKNHPDSWILVLAGRRENELSGMQLPEGCRIVKNPDITTDDVLGSGRAKAILVLDPADLQLDEILKSSFRYSSVVMVYENGATEDFPLHEQLTFFDRVVVRDSDSWQKIAKSYGFARSMRLEPIKTNLADTVVDICMRLRESGSDILADKSVYTSQDKVLNAYIGKDSEGAATSLLEMGARDGRWAMSLAAKAESSYQGVGLSVEHTKAALRDFPSLSMATFGDPIKPRNNSLGHDIVFAVDVLQHEPLDSRKEIISEMWRLSKPGGRMIFLEDFVPGSRKMPECRPLSVYEFVDLVLEATLDRVSLKYVRSIRYPKDDVVRGCLVSFMRLG